MDHIIQGELEIDGVNIDFSNGRGYLEKDWGRSFPSAYFWMQSNHFSEDGISLKCSVAKIPWVRSSFVGFIAGVWLKDRLIRFTTYNQSKLRKSFANEKEVEIILENKNYLLEILAHRDGATQLASPINGFMNGRIEESMTSSIAVMLTDKKNNKIPQLGSSSSLESFTDGDRLTTDGDRLTTDDIGLSTDDIGLSTDGIGLSTDGIGLSTDDIGLTADGDGLTADGDGLSTDDIGLTADGDGSTAGGNGLTTDDNGLTTEGRAIA